MKIISYKNVPPVFMNNGEIVRQVAGRVMIGQQDGAKNFCMRMFEIGPDGFTPRHTHDWEHEVFIHDGKGEVFIKDQWHPVTKGTAVFIPPDVLHQFRNTSGDTLAFICLIPSGAPEL